MAARLLAQKHDLSLWSQGDGRSSSAFYSGYCNTCNPLPTQMSAVLTRQAYYMLHDCDQEEKYVLFRTAHLAVKKDCIDQ